MSRLPLDRKRGLRLHQPLPFLDVLAHEQLVRGGPLNGAILQGVDASRYAETTVHVDPLVLFAPQTALNLLEVRDVVDFAEVREAFLRAHSKRVDVVQRFRTD